MSEYELQTPRAAISTGEIEWAAGRLGTGTKGPGLAAQAAAAVIPDAASAGADTPAAALDQLVARLAAKHFGIETLDTRISDRLDFHEIGVASLKDALKAAFLAVAEVGGGYAVTTMARK